MIVGTVHFKLLTEEAKKPFKAHRGDAGWDLFVSRQIVIEPGKWVDVHTDIAIQLPSDAWAEITGRSSTFRKLGVQVQHGIIDSDYRGELFVACYNFSDKPVLLNVGDRIAQLIPHPLFELVWRQSEELNDTLRSDKGFGSSGT